MLASLLIPVMVIWPWAAEPTRDQGDTITLQSIQFYCGDAALEESDISDTDIGDPFDIPPEDPEPYIQSHLTSPWRLK